MDASRIDRVNELYHKSQSMGLAEKEKEGQARLHQEYVATIRGSLCDNLDNISVKEPDGSITDLGRKHSGIKEV